MSEQIGTADRHYWLDRNGKVTTDELKGEVWLVREGSPITKEMADVYGIGKVAQPEPEAVETVKKAAKPSENKAEKPKENKGVK